MLRRLGIRGKVLATLSVPVLVLFILAGIVSNQAVQDLQAARATERLLEALDGARQFTKVVQAERATTMAAMMGDAEAREKLPAVREMTDRALAANGEAAAGVDLRGLDPMVERALTGLQDQSAIFAQLREVVDGERISPRAAYQGYTTVVERVARFPGVVAGALQDRDLGAIVQAQTDVVLLQEKYTQEQLFGAMVQGGLQSAGDSAVFLGLFPATNVAHETADLSVGGLEIEDLEVPPLRQGLGQYGSLRAIAAASILNFVGLGNPQQWQLLSQDQIDSYDAPVAELGQRALTLADRTANEATRTAIITIALSVLAVVLSIVIAFTISRGIVIPLRRLTEAAGQVRDELPRLVEQVAIPGQGPDLSLARIPVDSKDEVGQLAAAFNEVNSTTIEVAQEQAALRASIAEMFVNVARRDQVLLNRQLSFIDALERTEEDPATLADLFRLDHLATRMRRNAESLLVLAGIDTGRRLREPLPLSDVIRTASSEIEHYERIQLDLPIDPPMLGHVALPAAHLLAELLENATVFSDPGTPVHVSTGREPEHMLVTVYDQGLGMTADELRAANEKILTTSASEVLGAERLGLFVVGRIASRLGASVELSTGPDGTGTLATARFPVALFVAPESVPLTAPNAHGVGGEMLPGPEVAAGAVAGYGQDWDAPTGVQDVAPGSLGSAENPAQEVDLAQYTAGTTEHGLPKRRAREDNTAGTGLPIRGQVDYRTQDDAAAAASIPLAPRAEDLAGAAAFPSQDEEAWTPPVIEAQPLTVRRRTDAEPEPEPVADEEAWTPQSASTETPGLPTRKPAGLPTRTPAAPPQAPVGASAAPAAASPENPQERASMFTGFRSRRAELAAASLGTADPHDGTDGAERLAAAASGAAAFFGRGRDQEQVEAEQPEDARTEPAAADGTPSVAPAEEVAPRPVEAPEDGSWPPYPAAETEPPTTTGGMSRVGEPLTRRARRGRHAYYPEDQQDTTPAWAPTPSAESVDVAPVVDAVPAPKVPSHDAEQTWIVPALEDDEPAGQPTWETEPAWEEQQQAPVWQEEQQPAAEWSEQPGEEAWSSAEQPGEEAWSSAETAAPAWPPAETAPAPAASAPTGPAPLPTRTPAEAVPAAPTWPSPDVAATWEAPPAAWAPTAPAPAAEASAEQASGGSKRRWWQLGRKKKAETTPAPEAPREQTAMPSAMTFTPDPTQSAVPAPVVPTPPAVPTSSAPAEASPTRTSAWGPAQPGAHSGATSFFRPREDEASPEAPTWDVPSPRSTDEPAAEQTGWAPPPAPAAPVDQWAQAKPPAPEQLVPEPQGQPQPAAAFTPAPASSSTTFTPQSTDFADDVTSMLAQRADLAQQALAELSQLSSYRPQAVAGNASSLARRTPGRIPEAPAIKPRPAERPARDANQVRSLLSSFQSGTTRGREAADGAVQATGAPGTGVQDGGSGPDPDPVADPDMTQRSTAW